MKLTAKTDLDIPAAAVFARLTDHAAWEREAVRRGIEVERPADMPLSGIGAGWRIRAPYRGKMRKLLIRIEDMVQDQRLGFKIDSPSAEADAVVEVLMLSPRRTRLRVMVDVRPKTLAARLFLNTIRLAKGRVQSRFEQRLARLGQHIKDSHNRSQA
jgi:hypothetical protein